MITVSIVSNGHGAMVRHLIVQLLTFQEVGQVVVTFNIPENLDLPLDQRICIKSNILPLGFAANHNAAFEVSTQLFFCPLNPDIKCQDNPFPGLLAAMDGDRVGMVAPRVSSPGGKHEDSWRRFPTPLTPLLKLLGRFDGSYGLPVDNYPFSPEWVAGMFMLFRSQVFRELGGFDEKFFLYYEDVDICARLWRHGYRLLVCPVVVVVHDARRDSHRKLNHFGWHLNSMVRYFVKHWGRLPLTVQSSR